MEKIALAIIFIAGYFAIALEHPLRLNKAASALITGVLCWLVYFLGAVSPEAATEELMHHLGDISSILFFLLGAMTIVELIDTHGGFDIIKEKIVTRSTSKLLIIISIITFLLSALLDNLTTAIVMTSLCSRLLTIEEDRWWFASMIIIAANAGGAWSPLGDVTTTMLWIGGQVTAFSIIKNTVLPSITVCVVPALIIARKFKGIRLLPLETGVDQKTKEGKTILLSGIGLLIFVPAFKTTTHLPPFMGMLLALGIIWIITSVLHKNKQPEQKEKYSVSRALQKIDAPGILFFLGILLAVSALQSFGLLKLLSAFLDDTLKDNYLIGISLGLLSAVVDNVPLVAAAQGMYTLDQYPTDHYFWQFIALATGAGGSALIIGTAAGVAVMGIEKIDFVWYFKKITWIALLGFTVGVLVFIVQRMIFN